MNWLIGLLLFIPLCLACSSEQDNTEENANTIRFATAGNTRAIADITNIQNEGFSVWGGYGTTTVFNGESIVLGTDNLHATDKPWTTNDYSFYAVYPSTVNATYTPPTTFAINNYNVKDNQNADLMTAVVPSHAYPENGEAVGLYFKHVLAAVSLSIQLENNGHNYTNSYRIVSATIGNIYTSGDIGIDHGALPTTTPTGTKGNTNAITEFSGTSFTATSPMVSEPIMTMPQQATATLHLEIDVNGQIIEIDKENINVDWKAGNRYTYSITLNPLKGISISVTTTDWERPNISDIIIN